MKLSWNFEEVSMWLFKKSGILTFLSAFGSLILAASCTMFDALIYPTVFSFNSGLIGPFCCRLLLIPAFDAACIR